MENKYYIPDITEFRIGFEYEEKSSGLWTKQIYNKHSPVLNQEIWDEYGCKLNTIKDYIEQEQCRVKILDKEDIESFGFGFIYDNSKGDGNFRWYDLFIKDYVELAYFSYLGKEYTSLNYKLIVENKKTILFYFKEKLKINLN